MNKDFSFGMTEDFIDTFRYFKYQKRKKFPKSIKHCFYSVQAIDKIKFFSSTLLEWTANDQFQLLASLTVSNVVIYRWYTHHGQLKET